MSIVNLQRMFAPESIAVVGASEKPGSVGTAVMENLVKGRFAGRIYPINPKYYEIYNRRAYRSVRDLKDSADLVVIATPIHTVANTIEACAKSGSAGAVVISAGGKETGEKGAALEADILSRIKGRDFRIIGPNCIGIISTMRGLNASFADRMPERGKMAFISQSGAICTAILDFADKAHIGFSYFASLGSMLDVDFGDMIDYLGSDPHVSSIVMYVENLTRIRNFMSAARAVSRIKPIIALKAGRTEAGAAAAASHTGALAGEDVVYDAAFKRAGILRVKTFAELFDCAEFIGMQPTPAGPGLAILSNAGGPGVMAADALWDYDISPVKLHSETIAQLDAFLPDHWSRGNPVDILGDAEVERYGRAARILMHAKEVNGLLIMLAPQAITEPLRVAEALVEELKNASCPVFIAWLGGTDVEPGRAVFQQAGIPSFDSPERAVRAFMDLYYYSRNIEMLQQIPKKLPGTINFDQTTAKRLVEVGLSRKGGLLTEIESKDLLTAYGIPVNRAQVAETESEAVSLAEQSGFPVVMKVVSTQVLHKSDVGGVVLDIRDVQGVRSAFQRIRDSMISLYPDGFKGISVQKMLPRGDFELIVGEKRDRDFGPIILFGLGGILTEVLGDRSIALPPLNRLLARRMMEETRIYKVLSGYRGLAAMDNVQLESLLIRFSQLVTDFADIAAIDINPLIIHEGRAVAVDARVVVQPFTCLAPLHLVISPYPNEHEENIDIKGVGRLTLRPILPEDAPLLEDMFNALSPMSIYYRFFSPMKHLPHHMLARFTQIDYDREIAMVAISNADGKEKMLGVSRVILEQNLKKAEFAVLVDDQWQGKGIGAALLKRSLAIARKRNIEQIYGIVLPGNIKMLTLARKLGFDIKKEPDNTEYKLTLELRQLGSDENP